jgi:1,2-dihydroxy-3-keto-5-methylthiopentene dioxygenase
MSALTIFKYEGQVAHQSFHTKDAQSITDQLKQKGVRFERWLAKHEIKDGMTQDQILEIYAEQVNLLKAECGFITVDVVSLRPDFANKAVARQKFLDEHIHTEDEVRFFVFGQGLFYLHLDSEVFVVDCQQNDLISVPAGTLHWFDMGPEPNFTCIRFFNHPDGWVAQFSGDQIASHVPRYEGMTR